MNDFWQISTRKKTSNPTNCLVTAAKNGKIDAIRNLASKVQSLDAFERRGFTALMQAAASGHTEIVEELYNLGADLAISNHQGFTALILAAQNGNYDTVMALCELRADVNFADENGRTALLWAACNGHTRVLLEMHRKFGASITVADSRGCLPFTLALTNGHPETAKELFNLESNTAASVFWAAKQGCVSILKDLYQFQPCVDFFDEKGTTPLMWAAKNGHRQSVNELCRLGASIQCIDCDGWTPLALAADSGETDIASDLLAYDADAAVSLHQAAKHGHQHATKQLLELGASVNARDADGCTALTAALMSCQIATAHTLISRGASLRLSIDWAIEHARPDLLQTLRQFDPPLHFTRDELSLPLVRAAEIGSLQLVAGLLHLGADVNYARANQSTALICAADAGHMQVVGALIDRGADVNASDAEGLPALMRAAGRGNAVAVRQLHALGAKLEAGGVSALAEAAGGGHAGIVAVLCSLGAAVDHRNPWGRTALMRAAHCGHEEAVRALCTARADPQAADHGGRTALMWAASSGRTCAVEALCALGADVEAQDEDGRTALMLAAGWGHADAVRALLGVGASAARADRSGCAPLAWAAEFDNADVVRALCAAAVDLSRGDGPAVLIAAASAGHAATVEELLRHREALGVDREACGQALILAAAGGHEAVLALLAGCADVDARDGDGCTALMWAAAGGHVAAVARLGESGARPELCDEWGMSAMDWAAECGHAAAVAALHGLGADAQQGLIYAAASGQTDTVLQLCELGARADSEHAGADGVTALGWALENGHSATAQVLCVLGADAGAALLQAARAGRCQALRAACLLDPRARDARDVRGAPALVCALEAGQRDAALALKALGADPGAGLVWAAGTGAAHLLRPLLDLGGCTRACDGEGCPAAVLAVRNGHDAVVRELLGPGGGGELGVQWSAARGLVEEVRQLLALGVGTEGRDEGGRTALMLAAAAGETDVLAALHAAGADLEAADTEACPALAHAVREGHVAAAAALRGLGARIGPCLTWAAANGRVDTLLVGRQLDLDFDFGSSDGTLALALAARGGHVDALQELCRLGAGVGALLDGECTALHWAVGAGQRMAALTLLSLRADIEARDRQGRTALTWAAMNGHAETVACLLENSGADIKTRDLDGGTALMWAAKGGHVRVVECLCRLGAVLDAADCRGSTSLMWAAQSKSLETVLSLCDAGADVFACRNDGSRAVHCAKKNGTASVSQMLRAIEAEKAKLVLQSTASHARWACCLGASAGLSTYSQADIVALELAYARHHEKRANPTRKTLRKCLVRVEPEGCSPSVSYTVDVAAMQQQNMQSNFLRTVVRFYPPISWLNRFWENPSGQQLNHSRLVALVQHTEEYAMVYRLFQGARRVRAIHRVQNPGLFHSFQSRVNNLRAVCGDDWDESSMVRWLFHGTSDEAINEIIKDPVFGFKALLSQRASYGKGIYFSSTASYSVSYCCSSESSDGPGGRMLVGAVALGRFAQGNSRLCSPPPGYHSLANSADDPDIFVIPDGASAYPAYVISFT